MSDLDAQLKQRQKSTLLPMLIGALLALLLALTVVVYLFVVKGHTIKVSPEPAAQQAQFKVTSGMGWLSDNVLYRLASDVSVQVSSPTYYDHAQQITATTASVVEVELKPKPGTLAAKVSAPFAEHTLWVVDEQLLGKGAAISEPLEQGQYQLSIENPYYQRWQKRIELERAQTLTLEPLLKPIKGALTVASVPSGADVYVNDQLQGQTPFSLSVSGGIYQITVQKQGYRDSTEELEVTDQFPSVERNYQLKAQQATLAFTLQPSGGSLFVNGQLISETELSVDANTMHSVRYVKPGFYSFNSKVILPPQAHKAYPITLKPEQGKVTITSNVQAQVYIDEQPVATTPLTTMLPALAHDVKVAKPGYRAVHKKLTPSAEHPTTMHVELLTEFDARRREGRPLFVSTLGIEMKRFSMDAFTMGSPQNEIGRKRNEFPVKVDFSRTVWVSAHEISEAQFSAFANDVAPSSLPVSNISWLRALQYCNWLSEQEALTPYYRIANNQLLGINPQARGYRLLTEAEWEWLAKKAKRARATKYVWGDSERIPRDAGNFADSSLKGQQPFYFANYQDGFANKAPVGSFRADKAGLYDLAGNVSEWVFDSSSYVTPDLSKVHIDYTGPRSTGNPIAKGGNYLSGRMQSLRGAVKIISDGPSATIGFRIARYER
ncbi:PEGA domain-containing protein [Pseudoalteromonas ruthenica]|uniref:PEGA domain-containing protein n=2 Tax=Pseudoalteromonas TaxID=53246 RepID=UPI00110B16E5|nr:PEGA domain-containing protein [Pseudoalteromonas ruthenica]TMO48109.1 hypothetical protein CWC24_05365 [Pseudoalteromonas ruthenica]TMO48615.1 hypothetical protein CWC23_17350 [Pseudoalteromonas ruthenica]